MFDSPAAGDLQEQQVFLTEPRQTAYDLSFTLFGFPIRVHPAFFLMPLLLGAGLTRGFENAGVGYLIVVVIFFLSILVHELGHAFAFRRFGQPSRIVMYWFGGLAIPESTKWSRQESRPLSANQRMFISFAGPLAGFLLAGVLVAVGVAIGGVVELRWVVVPIPCVDFSEVGWLDSQAVNVFFFGGILINILLNLFNLLPVFPLDGGQIALQFLGQLDVRDGVRNSIILSVIVAGLLAAFALFHNDVFLAFFFGFLGYVNFQRLQVGRGW